MSTPAKVFQSFEAYEWDSEVYGALSLAARLAVNIRNKGNVVRLAYALHKISKTLDSLLNTVHEAMEGKVTSAKPHDEPMTPQRLRMTSDNITHLYQLLDYVYESCRRVGLLNNSLTSTALIRIHSHVEELNDIADWLEMASCPEKIDEVFNRSKEEKERGDVFDLSQVD